MIELFHSFFELFPFVFMILFSHFSFLFCFILVPCVFSMSAINLRNIVVGDIGTNCYLLYAKETNTLAIIDPGGEANRIVTLANSMRDAGQSKFSKVIIILTHAHFDHAEGLQDVRSTLGATDVFVHNADKPLYDTLQNQPSIFSMPPFDKQPDPPTEWLSGGEKIELSPGNCLEVFHTPGHTPGSVCLFLSSMKLLFSGDTLFEGAVGRTDLPLGNSGALEKSVKSLYKTFDDSVKVYPGHGSSTTIGHEKRYNCCVRA